MTRRTMVCMVFAMLGFMSAIAFRARANGDTAEAAGMVIIIGVLFAAAVLVTFGPYFSRRYRAVCYDTRGSIYLYDVTLGSRIVGLVRIYGGFVDATHTSTNFGVYLYPVRLPDGPKGRRARARAVREAVKALDIYWQRGAKGGFVCSVSEGGA